MNLGVFSVSLAVKDLHASKAFYGKLGFEKVGGDEAQNWLILANGPTVIGLFQGMFPKNTFTFNPGWDGPHSEADEFTDVRTIEQELKARGIEVVDTNTADKAEGPAHIMVIDPDGNPILIDQHR